MGPDTYPDVWKGPPVMETALEILARLGGDNPPELSELHAARDEIARELHAVSAKGGADLEALMSLRETYNLAAAAVSEAESAEKESSKQVEDLLADVPNPDAPDVDAEATEPEPVTAAGRVLSVREAVARLQLDRKPEDDLAAVNHTVLVGSDERPSATWGDIGAAFVDSARSLRTGKEKVVQIRSEYAADRTLSGKIDSNTRLIDSFVSPEAVTAAGGCCSLPTPIYENPVLSSLGRPIRDSLPTVGTTNRGTLAFYPAVCLPQPGADIWTCEQDELVDENDPTTWKECADVDCPDEQRLNVEGIYRCLTIGNFQARFAPEQWEAHLRAVAAMQARAAEAALFAKMRAGATSTHTGITTGDTYANVYNTVARAVALMRQDQRLEDVEFHLWIADWIRAAMREGRRVHGINTGADPEVPEAALEQAFANEGVRVTYSLDVDDLEAFQYDGALADYPATASAVLAPEGFYSFVDGGSFDLGTDIRDHDLNRQNKVAAFAESFEGLLARGCNSKALDIPVQVCETVPCP